MEQFPYLEELICDNNQISEKSNFPYLKSLKIFSCNKNNVNFKANFSSFNLTIETCFL
jgi:hypothetical protein